MEENYYKERKIVNKLPVIIIASLFFVIILILLFVFINNKSSKDTTFDIEKDFLTAGKKYFSSYDSNMPKEIGECSDTTLETILSKGIISNVEKYSSCNKYDTKIKVCKVDDGDYHYTPLLVCDFNKTEEKFSDWNIGTKNDLIDDKSDVVFEFLGYEKEVKEQQEPIEKWEDEITIDNYNILSTTVYYRYRDKEWQWKETYSEYFTKNDIDNSNVAYYATSPSSDYTNSDSETTAYKWFIETTIPNSPVKKYVCKNPNTSAIGTKNKPCSETADGKTETVREFYTCNVLMVDENGKSYYPEVSEDTLCDCRNDTYGKDCEVKKEYYPSLETDASREKAYYVSSPINGAIKDISTKSNVSRYYKEVDKITSKYYSKSPSNNAVKVGDSRWGSWTSYSQSKPKEYDTREIEVRKKIKYELKEDNNIDWVKISNEYLSLDEFINLLKNKNYQVDSLTDIINNKDLKYDIQLKYRNRNN